jgi:transposase
VARVVIGVDPHKASNTLVVIDDSEQVLVQRRFGNDRTGYREMKMFVQSFRDRVWAVEGAGESAPGWRNGSSPRTSRC